MLELQEGSARDKQCPSACSIEMPAEIWAKTVAPKPESRAGSDVCGSWLCAPVASFTFYPEQELSKNPLEKWNIRNYAPQCLLAHMPGMHQTERNSVLEHYSQGNFELDHEAFNMQISIFVINS